MELIVESSLAKIFPNRIYPGGFGGSLSLLKGERGALQAVLRSDRDEKTTLTVQKSDSLELTVYEVKYIPSAFPDYDDRDDYVLENASPGLYPDLLIPSEGEANLKGGEYKAFWLEFSSHSPGDYIIRLCAGDETGEAKISVLNIDAPKQTLKCTMWFHTDCLIDHYRLTFGSDGYFSCCESYLREASKHGMNMALTPLFTPPLDTAVHGERTTTQLVSVRTDGLGNYEFDFSLLERWIKMCLDCGIEYFEMSHLFTQWGAKAAPKIIASTPDGEKQLFGWRTRLYEGCEYEKFLCALAGPLIDFLKRLSITDNCYFHVSDEPDRKGLDSYKLAKGIFDRAFRGRVRHFDALVDVSLFREGFVDVPVPNVGSTMDFSNEDCEKWTYYCCGQYRDFLPNRFFCMPSLRSRILGFIMYKYKIEGFLQWGLNFWNTRYSLRSVDPFSETDAGGEFPSGDSFVLYPGEAQTPLKSFRFSVFYDAVRDYEALKLLETLAGREKCLEIIDPDSTLTFNNYPHDEKWLLSAREKINSALLVYAAD